MQDENVERQELHKRDDEWEVSSIEEVKEQYPHYTQDLHPPIPEITTGSIRRFAYGIGDDNPLWVDQEYGKKSKYGSILAPPSIVIGCGALGIIRGITPPSLRYKFDFLREGLDIKRDELKYKVHGWDSGSRIRWYKIIKPGYYLTNISYVYSIEQKPTKFAGKRSGIVTYGVDLFNPKQELVCRMYNWTFVALREDSKEKGKYKTIELKERWSDEELKELWNQYEKEYEQRRGAEQRYWEDVEIGDQWKLLKGPYTGTSGVAYMVGAVGETFVRTDRLMYTTYIKEHPAVGVRNRQNIPEPPVRVHWEGDLASNIGVPAAYDFGGQRIAWLSHVMTDWIGDDGFLKELEGKFVKFNYIGDVQWFTSKVVDKNVEGEDHLVKCEIEAVNQRGEVTTVGSAVAVLPTKNQ